MQVSGFFRCTCGKLHSTGGLSFTSQCGCGLMLYEVRFPSDPEVCTECRCGCSIRKVPYGWVHRGTGNQRCTDGHNARPMEE